MTTSHLDDEALSAALDGEMTAPEQAHLSSCSMCQAHLESLAAAARAVGAPVAPRPPGEVDDAIRRALRAGSESESESSSPETSTLASPVPIGVGSGRLPERRRGRSPRWLGAAAGIAAAVIVVGGVVALSRNGTSHTSTTAGLAQPSSASTSVAPDAANAGDLGDQSDPAALARRVTSAVAQRSGAAAATAPEFGATTVVGQSAAPRDQLASATCVVQAAAANGVVGSPSPDLVAPLRWRGEPAEVVVFSRPGGLTGTVMRLADCSVLVVLPL
jgi:hypothetical protein